MSWHPMESAPKDRPILVGWWVTGSTTGMRWWEQDLVEWSYVETGNDTFAGWATREQRGDRFLDEEPTHWAEVPAPPTQVR